MAHGVVRAFIREHKGALRNLAAASDIARIAVLYQHGGLYMDADVLSRRTVGEISPKPVFPD